MGRTKLSAPDQTTVASSTTRGEPSAATGIKLWAAKTGALATSTNVPAAENPRMALKNALSQRRRRPLTPLDADGWLTALQGSRLLDKYSLIPMYLRHGADAGIPQIQQSYTPLNKQSTETLKDAFNEMIQSEFIKGRYLGPYTKEELAREIGPFQSSPLSLIPKAGKPGKFRLIQNLSHPHSNQPTKSINAHLNSDDFPCTWGTFKTTCTLILGLPPGAQAATRDISEAYRIIPLHENQWPGIVVRISNEQDSFALNTSNSFGCSTAGGLFGLFGDALADLLRAAGIGPIVKWVDDYLFIRIPEKFRREYNETRGRNKEVIARNGGTLQNGGRLWFKGNTLEETGAEQFAEDCSFPIGRSKVYIDADTEFSYNFEDINLVTDPLGVPWETSKDIPFNKIVIFAGFAWDLDEKTVALPETKKEKYRRAIEEWRQRTTHTLEDTRKLYGKLLYTCHIVPQGRAYLTNFEKMMGIFHERPFTPRHPPKQLTDDLTWWHLLLSRPRLVREIPGRRHVTDVHGFSDASSSTGIGIILGDKWRAWRLLPGWNREGRDIGWAEAVAMELLVRTIFQHHNLPGIRVFGDNTGVVEGWWTGRSRNAETNKVFRRIHRLVDENVSFLTTRYVNTAHNPADNPSRGIYPPEHLLLPPIIIPSELEPFITDFDAPLRPSERLASTSIYSKPKPCLSTSEQSRRNKANNLADEQPDVSIQASTFGRSTQ